MSEYELDARVSRKKNNALRLDFIDRNGPVASAVQSGADGRKVRTAILMGWRNGGPGRHLITYADGREVVVEVGPQNNPVEVATTAGQPLATIHAGSPSVFRSADGSTVLHVNPDGPPSPAKVPMVVCRPTGAVVARMLDVRTNSEWKLRDSLRAAADLYTWVTASGAGSLPIKRFGTQMSADGAPAPGEVDALIAISVAVVIGMCDLVPQLDARQRS